MINRLRTAPFETLQVALLSLALTACGGGGGSDGGFQTPPDDTPSTPTVTTTVTAALVDSSGAASASEIEAGSTVTIEITLVSNDGVNDSPVADAVVQASTSLGTIEPASGSVLTDATGSASFEMAVGEVLGAGTVTVSADGATENAILNFEVIEPSVPLGTVLEILLFDSEGAEVGQEVDQGRSYTIRIKAVQSDGTVESALANRLVSASTTLGSISPGNSTSLTDENGIATLTLVAGSDLGAGTVTVTIEDDPAISSRNFQVIEPAVQLGTVIQLELLDTSDSSNPVAAGPQIELGQTFTLRSTVLLVGGAEPVPQSNIIVTAGTTAGTLNPSSGSLLTNNDGVADFTITGSGDLGAGVITVTAEGGVASSELNVEIITPDMPVFDQITATLLDAQGQPSNGDIESGSFATLLLTLERVNGGVPSVTVGEILSVNSTVGSVFPSSGTLLTNGAGQASFTINGTGDIGAGTVTASYAAGDVGVTTNIQIVEPIAQIGTSITIELEDAAGSAVTNRVEAGDTVVVVARLEESDGQNPPTGLADEILSATSNVGTISPASGNLLTDGDGVARFQLIADGALGAGTITVSSESGTATKTVNVEIIEAQVELGTRIELTLVNDQGTPVTSTNIESGTSRYLAISVLQNDGTQDTPLADVIVRATTTIGLIVPIRATALTDQNGLATLEIAGEGALGAGTVTVALDGDSSVSASKNLQIVAATTQPVPELRLALIDATGAAAEPTVNSVTSAILQVTAVETDGVTETALKNAILSASTTIGSLEPASGTVLTDQAGVASFAVRGTGQLGAGTITVALTGTSATASINIEVAEAQLLLGVFDAVDPTIFSPGVLRIPNLDQATFELAAGGSTRIEVDVARVVDGVTVPFEDNVTVVFTSSCAVSGSATVGPDDVATGGTADATYTAIDCEGDDPITAALALSSSVTAQGTINVLQSPANSITFVSAEPQIIGLRGTGGLGRSETSAVKFQVFDEIGQPAVGQQVNFALSTDVGALALTSDNATSDADGMVSAIVQSGDVATPVRVIASVDGTSVTSVSDRLVVTTGVPDQNSMSLSSDVFNIPGGDIDGSTAELTIRMADKFNNPVPDGTAATFWTEFGRIGAAAGACETTNSACSVTLESQNPRRPLGDDIADARNTIVNTVCPTYGAPGPCPEDLGNVYGRRSSILVFAVGEESFVDDNGNGKFDQGETFGDLGEAFIDNNEDGVYNGDCTDASLACLSGKEEVFVDFNGDGNYNGPNGQYNGLLCSVEGAGCTKQLLHIFDQSTEILSNTSQNVILTQNNQVWPSGQSIYLSDNPADPSAVGAQSFTAYVADIYNNAPATGATVSISTDCKLAGTPGVTMPNTTAPGALAVSFTLVPQAGNVEDVQGSVSITVSLPNGLSNPPVEYPCFDPPGS